jgi:putative DNA primase/helicase
MPTITECLGPLANERCYIVFKLVPGDAGRLEKVPVDPVKVLAGETRVNIDTHSPANWLTAHEAALYVSTLGQGYGVGIVIREGSGLFAVDVDDAVDAQGQWSAWAQQVVGRFPGAAMELSTSGKGFHILGRYSGTLEPHGSKNAALKTEAYTKFRFIALTGNCWQGDIQSDHTKALTSLLLEHFPPRPKVEGAEWTNTPVPQWSGPDDDNALLQKALNSHGAGVFMGSTKATFADLWAANPDKLARAFPSSTGDDWDRSSADLALANHLAFYTGNNCERMARFMKASGLKRDKWERADYFEGTILNACATQKEWYNKDHNKTSNTAVAPVGAAVASAVSAALPSQLVPGVSVAVTCAADITAEPIQWKWKGWLPLGKLVILAGNPGTGKSTVTYTLSSTVSTGGKWPDNTKCDVAGNVLIWSGEDDPGDTIIPRLIAAGADLNRIHIIRGKVGIDGKHIPFDPAKDIPQLESTVGALGGASLLIIDPIVSAVSGDSHKGNDVRRDLQPVVDFAARFDCTVIGITHFRKGSQGASPVERVLGSQAFGALARIVLVCAKNEEDGSRVLALAKSNISKDNGGVKYAIEPVVIVGGIETTKIVWGETIEGTAREILESFEPKTESEHEGGKAAECMNAMRALMTGPDMLPKEVASADIEANLSAAGYSERRIRKAREKLGVTYRSEGFPRRTFWKLPDPRTSPSVLAVSSFVTPTPSDVGMGKFALPPHLTSTGKQ